MRIFVFFLSLVFVSPAFACEGYQNAMGALEQAIQQSRSAQTSRDVPPISSINQAISDLERAIEKDRRAKAQAPRSQPKKSL